MNTLSFDDLDIIVNGPTTTYENSESNNSSLIVSVSYNNNSFLFMGDSENVRIDLSGRITENVKSSSLYGNEEWANNAGNDKIFAGVPFYNRTTYGYYIGNDRRIVEFTLNENTNFILNMMAKDNNIKVYRDDALVATANFSGSLDAKNNVYHKSNTSTTDGQIFIFANHNTERGTSDAATQFSKYRLYYFKMYDNDVLVRHFVPAMNTASKKIGLYDLVDGKFYENSGSGTFTEGNIVPENYITENTELTISENHTLYAMWGKEE